MPRSAYLLPAALGFLAACASNASQATVPLKSLGEFSDLPSTYEASASTEVWDTSDLAFEANENLDEVEFFIRIETRMAVLTDAEITALLGSQRHGAWSIKTNSNRARRWFDRVRETTEQRSQAITVTPDHSSYITTIHQSAFIERFDVTTSPNQMVADPVVAVANEGTAFVATASIEDGGERVLLAASLERHDLQSPMQPMEALLPRVPSTVTIQCPVTTHQRVEFEAELAPDEAVVAAIPRAGDDLRMDVILVTARVDEPL